MHKIQCQCGKLQGHIEDKGLSSRVICYCADCQAFARYLERADKVLDAHGGTEILQVAQPRIKFTQGAEHLAIMRLSEKGLFRWYSSCCNTPLGNTLSNPKLSFIGLIHSSLDASRIEQDFGNKIAKVNVASATGTPKPEQTGLMGTILRFIGMIISARISGRYKRSPLFTQAGEPVAPVTVLSREQRKTLKYGDGRGQAAQK
ncbi:DUF6151 family protein [Lacimicrobium alkaliphilum]|uniref:CENP-V/GFA domain-containing protein n=1 Tax=Lacimicrobium alkaliphilum TaxID=1526571 RepID=A0A0U3B490_9ALTE|nr:DUF6151 family protein [Lacimicrobium alkaliphilum]ALS98361.1 hypothetical protein AT746_08900 [Lacimicrobium alkaliphilum]